MEEAGRRRIGRPRLSGLEAVANPFNSLSQEERRDLFLETAAGLFEKKGYSNTSVEDIVRELGFTKGVFYYYWKNKQEVVQEIHDRALGLMKDRLDEAVACESSPAFRLEVAIRNHVEAVMQNRSIIAVLMGNFSFSEETLSGRQNYAQRFQELVEEGIAAGVVRDLDPKILTFAILGLCNSVAQWYRPEGRLPAEVILDVFSSFASHGWRADGSGE